MMSWRCFFFIYLWNARISLTEDKVIILSTHHWVVLCVPGWSLLRGLSFSVSYFFLGCVCVGEGWGGEPAEPGPDENKTNWSRKCHFLTFNQQDLDQKESVRNTNRKEPTLKGAEQLTITFAIKRETSRCVTLFRNAECSSTLHMLLVNVGPWRRMVLCLVILN